MPIPRYKPSEVITLNDACEYINECLNRRRELSDEQAAASIVGLGGSDHYDEWLHNEPSLDEIMAIASDLEWSNGSAETLRQDRERLNELTAQLRHKYKSL